MKDDENIKRLGDKFLGGLPLEEPSIDFSAKVMAQLQPAPVDRSHFLYKPLINNWGWAGIFCLISGILAYSIFLGKNGAGLPEMDWFNEKTENIIMLFSVHKFPEMSSAFISVMLVFSFMALLEISIIKRIFDYRSTQ